MDKHQGTISVYSKGEGFGSCFTMSIPMKWDGTTRSMESFAEEEEDGGLPRLPLFEQIRNPLSGKSVKSSVPSGKSAKSQKLSSSGKSVQFDGILYTAVGGDIEVGGGGGDGRGGAESRDRILAVGDDTALVVGSTPAPLTGGEMRVIPAHLSHLSPLFAHTIKAPPPSTRTYRLLIVDDSQMSRKMLMRVMKGQGYTCEEVENGQQAVDVIKHVLSGVKPGGYFDCILMDYMMPVLDGPSATKQIRDLGYTGKIFAVTGNVLQHDIDHFIACGANLVSVCHWYYCV